MTSSPAPNSVRTASWLGYAGLIPFVVGTAVLIEGRIGVRELALEGLIAYAAVILGFMGAVHWGRAMFAATGVEAARAFALSVVPALVGWCATFLAARLALSVLAAAFVGLYLYDRSTMRRVTSDDTHSLELPALDWYLPLRLRLTTVVVVCLLLCVVLL